MTCLAHLFRKRRSRRNTTFVVAEHKMASPAEEHSAAMDENPGMDPVLQQPAASRWRRVFGGKVKEEPESSENPTYRAKSTLGILSDRETDEVPGK